MTDKTAPKTPRRMALPPADDAALGAARVTPPEAAATLPRPESKIARVTRLLERTEGASLDDMVRATGWQRHTTRAALTGLKKKGKVITKSKRDDVTRYFIASRVA